MGLLLSLKYPSKGDLNLKGGTPSPPHNPWPRPWVLFIPQPHNEHSTTELDYHPPVSTRATSFLPKTPVETEEDYSVELGTIFCIWNVDVPGWQQEAATDKVWLLPSLKLHTHKSPTPQRDAPLVQKDRA